MTQRATSPGTAQGTILGTIQYMAPEQVEGKEADARSDIWALGAVIYEMVTATRPFVGDTPASVIGAILKDTPPPISTRQPLAPRALNDVVERASRRTPTNGGRASPTSGGFFRGSHRTGQQALSCILTHAVHGANARPGS